MKVKNVKVYCFGRETFWAKGASVLNTEGKEMEPRIVVMAIRVYPLLKEIAIDLSDGSTQVYRGLPMSYEYDRSVLELFLEAFWREVKMAVKELWAKINGKEGGMPPGRTGNE